MVERRKRAGRRVEAQRKVVEERAANMKKYIATYMSDLGTMHGIVYAEHAGYAVVGFLDMVKERNPDWDIESIGGCNDEEHVTAFAIGARWCIQVVNAAAWVASTEMPPLEAAWFTGGVKMPGGTA